MFGVPKERFKEEDSFEEMLKGKAFGCKLNSIQGRGLLGHFIEMWKSNFNCGDSRKFGLARSRSSKRNRLERKQGQRRMFYARMRFLGGSWFHLVVSDETFKDLRQKHVKIRFAIE